MNWLVYLLQVNLALLICWALFFIAFKPLTFFHWNRYYLLGSVVFSLLLPLLKLQFINPMEVPAEIGGIDWQYVDHLVTNPVLLSSAAKEISPGSVFLVIYLLVAFSLLVFSVYRNKLFYASVAKARKVSDGRIKVYIQDKSKGSFTLFRRIYLNKESYDQSSVHILRHEMVHATQLHSVDLLLMELVVIFLWFNPFVFLLLRHIRDNHEFLADEHASKSPDSLLDYLACLKAETIRRYTPAIASGFKCSTIKKRIIMLTNNRSRGKYKLRYLGILPAIGLMVMLFHVPAESTVARPAMETDGIPSVFPLPSEYKNKITWNYDKEAVNPISGKKRVHRGVDISAPTGTPVYASGSGVVKQAEDLEGWGMIVILEHMEGISSRYAHLDRFEVKTGDKVSKGQLIGRVGSTGRSTGPHLHYEVRKDGNPVDPGKYY